MSRSTGWIAATLVVAGCLLAPPKARAEGRLEAVLEAPYPFDPDRSAVVKLTLQNAGDRPATIFMFDTPFAAAGGRLPRSQFVVTDASGAEVRYRGRWVNAKPVLASNFYTLQPGEVMSKEVDLIHEYNYGNGGAFAVSYSVDLNREFDPGVVPSVERRSFVRNEQRRIDSNAVVIHVAGPSVKLTAPADNSSWPD
ncbi:MAG: hypothetical protein ABWX83_02310 [Luteibacter sp.]